MIGAVSQEILLGHPGAGALVQILVPSGWSVRETLLAGVSLLLALGMAVLLAVWVRSRNARRASSRWILTDAVERLHLAFEYAPDAYYLSDLDGRFVDGNRAVETLLGYPREELIGRTILALKLLSPDQHAQAAAVQARHIEGESTGPDVFILNRKDGSQVNVELNTYPVKLDGEILVLGIARDITERKQAEVTLMKLQNAVEASGDAVFMTDRQGVLTYVNPKFTQLYGWTAEEVIGKVTPRILKGGLTEPHQYEAFWQTLLSKQVFKGEFVNKAKDGRMIHIAGSANPILDDQGEIIGFLAIQSDITERVRAVSAERAARQLAEERAAELHVLERAAQALNQAVTLGDPLEPALGQIMELVEATSGWVVLLEESAGTRLAAARGLPQGLEADDHAAMEWFGCTCQRKLLKGELETAANLKGCDRLAQVNGNAGAECHHATVPLRVGEQALGNLNLIPPPGRTFSDQELRLLTAIGAQFSVAIERARLFGEVQLLAITDSLTGLYNRRHFFTLSRNEFDRARRYQRPLAILMYDLDHFKRVNDTYGHAVGDMVLREVAARCQENLRKVDILGRYGGEEFTVLLPETDLAGARKVGERLRHKIAGTPIETERGPVSITVSVGVACLDEQCAILDELLERADQALYLAKQAGRNQVSAAS